MVSVSSGAMAQIDHLGFDAFLCQFVGGFERVALPFDHDTMVTCPPVRTTRALPIGIT